jgi:hypothetical protein
MQYGTGEACDSRPSSFSMNADRLEQFEMELKSLAERLGPILSPDTRLEKTSNGAAPRIPMSAFREQSERFSDMISRLRNLRERIDL